MSYFFLSFYLIPTPVKMPLKTPPPMPTATTRLPLNTFMLDGLRTEFNSFSKRRRNEYWVVNKMVASLQYVKEGFFFLLPDGVLSTLSVALCGCIYGLWLLVDRWYGRCYHRCCWLLLLFLLLLFFYFCLIQKELYTVRRGLSEYPLTPHLLKYEYMKHKNNCKGSVMTGTVRKLINRGYN